MSKGRRFLVVIILAMALPAIGLATSGAEYTGEVSLVFEQVDYNLNGEIAIDSAWGSVLLTYEGSQEILYFNLTVDGVWVVQNVPIFSHEGVGASQALGFNYEMEIDDGTPVSQVQYGYSITDDVIDAMPAAVDTAPVIDRDVAFFSGLSPEELVGTDSPPGPPGPAPGPPPGPLPTGTSDEKTMDRPPTSTAPRGMRIEDFAMHDGPFPNQDCGPNQCVLAAVSNSLRYLNERYNLGMSEDMISIEALAAPLGWSRESGVTGYDNPMTHWDFKKMIYMSEKGLPIVTDVPSLPNNHSTLLHALEELKRGQDVEISAQDRLPDENNVSWGHTAAVVAMAERGNGNVVFYVAHDTDQEKDTPNDNRVEAVEWGRETGQLTGGWGFHNRVLYKIVVECPDQQTQPPATPGPTPPPTTPPATPPTTPPPSTPPPPQSPSQTPGTSPPPTTPATPPPSTTPPETTPPPSTPPATPPQTTPPGTTPPTTPPGSSPPPGTPPGTTASPEQQGSDLAIEIRRASCLCPTRTPGAPPTCAVHVIAIVHSIGTETVWGKYVVELSSEWGSSQRIIYGNLNPQPTVMADLGFTIPNYLVPCPIEATVIVDSQNEIDECNELNNTVSVVICCEIVPEGAEEEFVPDDD